MAAETFTQVFTIYPEKTEKARSFLKSKGIKPDFFDDYPYKMDELLKEYLEENKNNIFINICMGIIIGVLLTAGTLFIMAL